MVLQLTELVYRGALLKLQHQLGRVPSSCVADALRWEIMSDPHTLRALWRDTAYRPYIIEASRTIEVQHAP